MNEAVGLISVCVNVSGAVLDRNITVFLSTENNTAVCEFLFVFHLFSVCQIVNCIPQAVLLVIMCGLPTSLSSHLSSSAMGVFLRDYGTLHLN